MEKEEEFHFGICLAGTISTGVGTAKDFKSMPIKERISFSFGRKLFINRKEIEMLMAACKDSLKHHYQLVS
ncbi:hypothetical protein J0A67_06240 [Algoriphagus aestuariicola]|jgi:hypothetical protein|uniref:Uncharacterized protein n=1 Tax=Algoriphagus aestuariicola TaxID=1852016 RepID=A0ABS3BQB4_9BACT|nr:hypothetical protein [Algoriphagus aestuariicola]MBN7800451.1 hypothetical protein [Algoriphagus aestuariicola]